MLSVYSRDIKLYRISKWNLFDSKKKATFLLNQQNMDSMSDSTIIQF